MQLAIQERLLLGNTTLARFQQARSLELDGVEVSAEGLDERIPEILEALQATNLRVSAVNVGHSRLLHAEFDEREHALVVIREAMTQAIDLEAQGVVFIPHYSTIAGLPDLHPYKSPAELEGQLLIAQLKATLGDLAYALGTQLYMAVVSHHHAHLINRMEQANRVLKANQFHPHLKVCATLCDMLVEEDDALASLRTYSEIIEYVHIADTDRGLPSTGSVDFKAMIDALKDTGYTGWLTLACDVDDATNADLEQSVKHLRDCGVA